MLDFETSMSGFVEFIVACSWENLADFLTLIQLISIAFIFDLGNI